MLFLLLFTLLTALYVMVTYVVMERFYPEKVEALRQKWDNNVPFWFLLVATLVTGVLALFVFEWGPALLLPDYPTPEQRGWASNTWEFLLKGKNMQQVETPSTPLPWTGGTWFWWKATWLYLVLTFLYSFYAWHDEAIEAYQRRVERLLREEEEKKKAGKETPGGSGGHHTSPPQPPPPGGGQTWGGRIFIEFLAELMAEFVVKFFMRKGGH